LTALKEMPFMMRKFGTLLLIAVCCYLLLAKLPIQQLLASSCSLFSFFIEVRLGKVASCWLEKYSHMLLYLCSGLVYNIFAVLEDMVLQMVSTKINYDNK